MGYHTPLPSGEPASEPRPTNPRPGTLSWDPPKQAFRLREAAKSCNCAELPTSRLTGERLTAGSVTVGRRSRAVSTHVLMSGKRFAAWRAGSCARSSEAPGAHPCLCPGCDAIRSRLPVGTSPEQVMRWKSTVGSMPLIVGSLRK